MFKFPFDKKLGLKKKQPEDAHFLVIELTHRLLDRLDYLRLQPKRILALTHPFFSIRSLLKSRFPKAYCIENFPPYQQHQFLAPKKKAQFKGLSFQLPFTDNSFDLIIAPNLWLPPAQLQACWPDFFRCLTLGGVILFSSFGPDTLRSWRLTETERLASSRFAFLDMHDMGDGLMGAGFSDPVMDREDLTIYYDHFSQLCAELTANLSHQLNSPLLSPEQAIVWEKTYPKIEQRYPIELELIQGQAWKLRESVKALTLQTIPLSAIKRRSSS